ncbi:MAG: energy transducer TonB [Gammaproteobacteria bacterium]|nr:energy transducer TonB [Gammaproteobacteria bacterium]
MIRQVGALVLGLIISLALFWLMYSMIMSNQTGLKETDNLQMIEFVRLKRETRTQTRDRKIPEKPKPVKQPPPPQMQMVQSRVSSKTLPNMDMPNLDIPLQTSRFSGSLIGGVQMGAGKVSTNVIPLVRIPPRYPMRAARRKIEGWVKVEFTITETGTVKDAIAVESQPGDIFNSSALDAIRKWKFKPKIIDGETFEQRAVQILQFKLKK